MKNMYNARGGLIKSVTDFTLLSDKDTSSSGNRIALLSDNELYKKCQHYGGQALGWRWKFAGLLPEVDRRKLYEKKGFSSIFHFAKVLAGLSEDQVRQAFRLDKKLEKTPILKRMFLDGKVSPNKLDRITSIASLENEEELAVKVKILSKGAVETFVRDIKSQNSLPGQEFGSQLSLQSADVVIGGIGHTELNLSPEIKRKLLELQHKGIDINQLLAEFLKKREQAIEDEKFKLAQECRPVKTRYISAKVRKILRKEYGIKCSIRTCTRRSEQIHHTQRFALSRNHDPNFLAPLCREHHEIASAIDTKTLEKKWRL